MLNLHPESDLSLNPIVLGSDVIKSLRAGKYEFVDFTLKNFLGADPKRTTEQFLDSLTLLYALGLIDYSGHRIKSKK